MKIKKLRFICFLIAALFFFNGCEDAEESDTYNFKVTSSDGQFEGYYMVDGGSMQYFSCETASGNTSFYTYQENLSSPGSITIYAKGTDISATSISIYIYENDVLGDSITVSQSTDSDGNALKVVATLSYTFNEDEDE